MEIFKFTPALLRIPVIECKEGNKARIESLGILMFKS